MRDGFRENLLADLAMIGRTYMGILAAYDTKL